MTIRVLVVQDVSPHRRKLRDALQRDADIAVVGEYACAEVAIEQIARIRPDVLVVDLQLADGGAHHVIEQVMARTPTPILVLSGRTHDRNSPSAVEALVAGALDVLPTTDGWTAGRDDELRHSVRQLSKVRVIRHPRGHLIGAPRQTGGGSSPVVALAASTGGPRALATLLGELAGLPAPILVVQHLHPEFTGGLLEWMSRASALPVEIARDGAAQPGRVYLAPAGVHLRLTANRRLVLDPAPTGTHRPSADQLFRSVAEHAGPEGVGVLLTGMGDDGARGLLEIRRRGGHTLAQDEASCAVFGMPRAAHRIGAVSTLLPLDQLAAAVRQTVREVAR